jgi:hypothetical protein
MNGAAIDKKIIHANGYIRFINSDIARFIAEFCKHNENNKPIQNLEDLKDLEEIYSLGIFEHNTNYSCFINPIHTVDELITKINNEKITSIETLENHIKSIKEEIKNKIVDNAYYLGSLFDLKSERGNFTYYTTSDIKIDNDIHDMIFKYSMGVLNKVELINRNPNMLNKIIDEVENDNRFKFICDKEIEKIKNNADDFKRLHIMFEFINNNNFTFRYTKFGDLYKWMQLTCINNYQLPTMDASSMPVYDPSIIFCNNLIGSNNYIIRYDFSKSVKKMYRAQHAYSFANIFTYNENTNFQSNIYSTFCHSLYEDKFYNAREKTLKNNKVDEHGNDFRINISGLSGNKSFIECKKIYDENKSFGCLAKIYLFYNLTRPIQKKIIESYIVEKARNMLPKEDTIFIEQSLWNNVDKYLNTTSPLNNNNTMKNINNKYEIKHLNFVYTPINLTNYRTFLNQENLLTTVEQKIAYTESFIRNNNKDIINSGCKRNVNNPFIEKFMTYLNAAVSTKYSSDTESSIEKRSIANHLYMSYEGSSYSCIDTLRFGKHLLLSESFDKNIKRIHDAIDTYKEHNGTQMLIGCIQNFPARIVYKIIETFVYHISHAVHLHSHDITRRVIYYRQFVRHIITKFNSHTITINGTECKHNDDTNIINTINFINDEIADEYVNGLKNLLDEIMNIYFIPNNTNFTAVPKPSNKITEESQSIKDNLPNVIGNITKSTRPMFPEMLYLLDSLYNVLYFDNKLLDKSNNVSMKIMTFKHILQLLDNITGSIIRLDTSKVFDRSAPSAENDINEDSSFTVGYADGTNYYANMCTIYNLTIQSNGAMFYSNAILLRFLRVLNRLEYLFKDVKLPSVYLSQPIDAFISSIILQNYFEIENVGNKIKNDKILTNMKYSADINVTLYETSLFASHFILLFNTKSSNTVPNNPIYPSNLLEIYLRTNSNNSSYPRKKRPWLTERRINKPANAYPPEHNAALAVDDIIINTSDKAFSINKSIQALLFKDRCITFLLKLLTQYCSNNDITSTTVNSKYNLMRNNIKKLKNIEINNKDFEKYREHINSAFKCVYIALYDINRIQKDIINALQENEEGRNKKSCFMKFGIRGIDPDELSKYHHQGEFNAENVKIFLLSPDDTDDDGVIYTQDNLFKLNNLFGNTDSKIQYGLRSIVYSNEINYDKFPSIKEFINKYNDTILSSNKIEPDRYLEFIKRVISIVKYNLDSRNFKSYVQTDFWANIELNKPIEYNKPDRPCPRIVISQDPTPIKDTELSNFKRIEIGEYNSKGDKLQKTMKAYSYQWDQKAYNIIF